MDRILSVIHFTSEAVLVSRRWSREHDDQSLTRSRLLSSYASTETRLPLSHKIMWVTANINTDIAALCTIVYWVFLYEHGSHPLDADNISGHVLICFINAVDIFVSQRLCFVSQIFFKV